MIRMFFIHVLFFCLPLAGCVYSGGDGYIKMPDEFFGYWEPHSDQANVGMDVGHDVVLYKDYGTDFVRYEERYRVFYVDNEYVYIIARRQITPEWRRESLRLMGEDEEKIQKIMGEVVEPVFFYRRYSLVPCAGGVDLIIVNTQDCNLTKNDWDMPAGVHRKRIENRDCPSASIGWFASVETWSAGGKTGG